MTGVEVWVVMRYGNSVGEQDYADDDPVAVCTSLLRAAAVARRLNVPGVFADHGVHGPFVLDGGER